MAYGALFIGSLVLALYSLLDVATTPGEAVRNLPKAAWIVLIIVFPLLGSVGWLLAGRPQQRAAGLPYKGSRGGQPTRRQLPPDDDPEFLRIADQSISEDKDLLAKWEADLKRREDELRRQRDAGDDPA